MPPTPRTVTTTATPLRAGYALAVMAMPCRKVPLPDSPLVWRAEPGRPCRRHGWTLTARAADHVQSPDRRTDTAGHDPAAKLAPLMSRARADGSCWHHSGGQYQARVADRKITQP